MTTLLRTKGSTCSPTSSLHHFTTRVHRGTHNNQSVKTSCHDRVLILQIGGFRSSTTSSHHFTTRVHRGRHNTPPCKSVMSRPRLDPLKWRLSIVLLASRTSLRTRRAGTLRYEMSSTRLFLKPTWAFDPRPRGHSMGQCPRPVVSNQLRPHSNHENESKLSGNKQI